MPDDQLQVHWGRWARVEAAYLSRSREVTRSRVLLECPLGWQWYLGDRVTRQSLGLPVFVVPGVLPPRVQRTGTYTRAELEQFTVPDTDLERHLRRALDYTIYVNSHLAISLGVEEELRRRQAAGGRGPGAGGVIEGGRGPGAGGAIGERGRGGRAKRGRGRGSRSPVGGRGVGPSGRVEGRERVAERVETSVPVALPPLKWTVGVTNPSGVRGVVDVPRLPQPQMRFPAQV
jgi:hypothetical protein